MNPSLPTSSDASPDAPSVGGVGPHSGAPADVMTAAAQGQSGPGALLPTLQPAGPPAEGTTAGMETPSGAAAAPWGQGINYQRFLDCVHCGLCTAACPTYLETGDENNSPRGRIYLMRQLTDGRMKLTPEVSRHLDLCLDCRSCETACPSGVQYGRLIEPFRVEMRQKEAQTKGGFDWFQYFILYGLFPYPKRLAWALWPARLLQRTGLDKWVERSGLLNLLPEKLRRMQRLLPQPAAARPALPEFLPAIGPRRARVALFTGCVAEAMFHHVNWATARVLQANGCDVIIPRTQACCGAIHYHSGAGEPALALARQNMTALGRDDIDAVVVNVAGCGAMLKDYAHLADETAPNDHALHDSLAQFAGQIVDCSEFLARLGLAQPLGPVPLTATYHDACHLAHAQRVRDEPRSLLQSIPGLTLVPLRESDICCGAAGSYNLTEGAMADRLATRKCENILATGAAAVVSANAGCTLQINAALRDSGHPLPVLHPMELLERSLDAAGK